jgi:hypothetical protein
VLMVPNLGQAADNARDAARRVVAG